MGLVDLRDRLNEPAVRAFLADGDLDSEALLIGWEEAGRLVAESLPRYRLLADRVHGAISRRRERMF
jgi:hypothetical protein